MALVLVSPGRQYGLVAPQRRPCRDRIRSTLRRALRRLEPFRIIAGMPADVFLETGHRTALSFLTRPLTDQVAKAFRER